MPVTVATGVHGIVHIKAYERGADFHALAFPQIDHGIRLQYVRAQTMSDKAAWPDRQNSVKNIEAMMPLATTNAICICASV
jgi:hypothetical protein